MPDATIVAGILKAVINVTEAPSKTLDGTRWPVALAMALLVFFTTFFYIKNVPLGQPPDEWAHLSYVANVVSGPGLIPNYSDSVILNSGQKNYLVHPPLYYSILGGIGRVLSWDVRADYKRYRSISAFMVSAGVFLWVLVALELGFTAIQAVGLTVVTLAIPMFPYLAGSVNNDNLCYLGVALFFYGFLLLPSSVRRGSYLSAAGVLIVLLTKATGAVFLLTFIAAWSVLDRRSALTLMKEKHFIVAASTVTLVGAAYFIPTTIIHHTPFPATGTLYQQFSPPEAPVRFLQYAGSFSGKMIERLPLVLTAKPIYPIASTLYPLFYLMLCLPLMAWVSVRPFSTQVYKRNLTDAFVIALMITIFANIWVGWHGYLQNGLYAGIQPRYYNYVVPGLFIFSFSEGIEFRRKQYLLLVFVCIAMVFVATIPSRAAMSLLSRPQSERLARLTAPSLPLVPMATLRKVAAPQPAAGYVDRVEVRGETVRVTGWAIDILSKQPARTLWVNLDGHLIGTSHPTEERKDVEQATGSPGALRSGFSITVSNVPAGLTACDVTIEAEQDDGLLATLANPACR